MSFYGAGLSAGAIAIPEEVQFHLDRLGRISAGYHKVRRGEGRFYGRGLAAGALVGAQTGGPVGGAVDSLMGLILDVAHVLLILGGMFLLWQGITGNL